jgi:hypothetical protein
VPDGIQLRGSGVAVDGGAVPSVFGSLLLESGSFVFTDIGASTAAGRCSTRS